jgi:concanavalin A-like lectin/glucanase superfamily protein
LIKISRRTALKRAGTGAALAWTAALLVGVAPASAASGPVALWHMDETSGSAMKDSSGSHTGSLHSVQLGQSGYLGTAYGFTGSSSVSVPSASDLNAGSKDITVTIHLKATSVPKKPDWDLIRKGKADTSGGEWKMEYQPNGKASCGFKGSRSESLTAGPALNNGKWHTVQCVKTSSAIKLVVDGQAYSKSANIGSISNSAPVLIGSHGSSEYFKGTLDEASIQIG